MTYRSLTPSLLLVVSCLTLQRAASARSLATGDTPAGEYTSNTQQCIVSSPKLQACAQLPFGSQLSHLVERGWALPGVLQRAARV